MLKFIKYSLYVLTPIIITFTLYLIYLYIVDTEITLINVLTMTANSVSFVFISLAFKNVCKTEEILKDMKINGYK